VTRSGWLIPLRADQRYKPLDLNVICGRDFIFLGAHQKKKTAAAHQRRFGGGSPAAVQRRPSAMGNDGRWAACDGDHGGGLR
jgi:hypothetical protein